MRYREILNEMIWDDRFAAARAARKYPRDWIHFSNIDKLGVNPQKKHRDPPGVYFYPIKFLFSEEASLSQYATEYPYYFIVRIKRNARILNLRKITMEEVEQLAKQNGWYDDLERVRANPALLKDIRQLAPRLLKRPGGLLYATLDFLANVEKRPWLVMLRGYDAMVDPGLAIISPGELTQMVVFNPKVMTILDRGNNTDNFSREYAGLLKQIADEFGGRFYYQHKVPRIDLNVDGKPIKVAFDPWRSFYLEVSYFDQGFWVTHYHKYDTYAGDRDHHYRNLRYYVRDAINKAGEAGNNFYWNGETVTAVFQAIIPKLSRTNQKVEDDGLHVWWLDSGLGSMYRGVRAIVNDQDQLTISARISLQSIDLESEHTFPPHTDPQTIANILLRELVEQFQKQRPQGNLEALRKVTGFAFPT